MSTDDLLRRIDAVSRDPNASIGEAQALLISAGYAIRHLQSEVGEWKAEAIRLGDAMPDNGGDI